MSSWNDVTKKVREIRKNFVVRCAISFVAVLASALLQSYVILAFIRPAGLLSSGFTGLAILIDRIAELYGFTVSTSLALVVLNLPVALMCCRSINVKFTVFSLLQVFFASFFLKVCHYTPLFEDLTLNVIFGGVLYGLSVVLSLKGNASTGGTDFIALYVSNKTGKSIWNYVFMGNVCILVIFGHMFGWEYAGYSILFQFISTKMISTFHHRYDRVTLQITTEKAEEVMKAYVSKYHHGISCVDAIGGYSHKKMYLLHTVISSYEINDIVQLIQEVDENVIINLFKTEDFYGGFYRESLD